LCCDIGATCKLMKTTNSPMSFRDVAALKKAYDQLS